MVAGAVILNIETLPKSLRLGLDDSKKLTSKKREELFQLLLTCAKIGIGISSVDEIDTLNILQATMLAMKRAVEGLRLAPGMILVDGQSSSRLVISQSGHHQGRWAIPVHCRCFDRR